MKSVITICLSLCLSGIALADPALNLNTAADFQAAINAGNIQPVTAWNPVFEGLYPGQAGDFHQSDIYAYNGVYTDPLINGGNPVSLDGLVMEWDHVSDRDAIAAWKYIYPTDPDLTGYIIKLGVIPPPNMKTVSIGLFDVNGNARGWHWNIPVPLPAGVHTTLYIDPSIAGLAGHPGVIQPTGFMQTPGFDITKVVSYQFDENCHWIGGAYPISPGLNMKAWNYWDGIQVYQPIIPEPMPLALAGIALLALRKRRS